jgi:hypothetical protein
MVWAKNGTPDTLGSAGDVLTISDMSANKFNTILAHYFLSGADTFRRITFNNNTNSVYNRRYSSNGAADSTATSEAYWEWTLGDGDHFSVCYACNISGEEKLGIAFNMNQITAGAGTAPQRNESVHKFVPSPDADITRLDSTNTQAGVDYAISSNLSALGSDGVESLNVQDGAVYYETDTNKEYVLYNNAWTEL